MEICGCWDSLRLLASMEAASQALDNLTRIGRFLFSVYRLVGDRRA